MNKIKLLGVVLAALLLSQNVCAQPQVPAKRIIALAPHIVEMLFEIGAGATVVGTTEHSDYPEAAKQIPRIGNYANLNIEQILATAPDVIIAWKTGNPEDDLQRLAGLGIPIVYSHPQALTDVAKELMMLGDLTGHQAEAKKLADDYLYTLNALKDEYRTSTAISVFYELWPRPLTTVANQAWPQKQLDVCGTSNPFKQTQGDYPQINIEQVVLAAPEIIIQPKSNGVVSSDSVDWQQWPAIPAVKQQAFLHPNADMLHRMTARGLTELAKLCADIDTLRKKY